MERKVPDRDQLYTVDGLLDDPAFKKSFIAASGKLALRERTFPILQSHCLLEILSIMRKLEQKLLSDEPAGKKLKKE